MTLEVNFQPSVDVDKKVIEFLNTGKAKKTDKPVSIHRSTIEETSAKPSIQDYTYNVEKVFPNCDITREQALIDWRELTKNEPSRESQFAELKAQGKTPEEAIEEMKKREILTLRRDTQYLRELFAKDPDARIKFQENFTKLSRREQKAVLNEAYSSGRKLGKDEISRLLQGLSSSSDEVKSLTIAQLRNDPRVTKEQLRQLEDRLNVAEFKVVNRLPKMETLEAANVVDTVMSDKKSVCRAQVAENLPKCNKEVIPYAVRTFANAETVRNDDAAKQAYVKSLPKYDDENQVYASKMGLNSDKFNSKDRDGIIGQIKNFSNPDCQKQVANYAIDCDKVDSDNRKYLAKEIKNLKPEVQNSVSEHFAANEKNAKDASVMKTYAEEMQQAKLQEEKQRQIEAAEQEKQIKAANEEVSSSFKAIPSEVQELLKSVNVNPFKNVAAASAAKVQKVERPTALTFAFFINADTISVSTVKNAGYSNALMRYFGDLSIRKQEEVLNSLTKEQLLGMYSKNKLPERFKKFLLAKASQATVDSVTAGKIASSASKNDVVSLFQCAKTEKNKEVYKEALKKRFHDKYEELFGKGQIKGELA